MTPSPLTLLPLVALSLISLSAAMTFPNFTAERCASLPVLVCNVQPTEGFTTSGAVYFSPVWQERAPGADFTCFTRISASVSGLAGPSHGFHVHTYGDLSLTDGTSTGGHFSNPAGSDTAHGLPDQPVRHWGDFGNIDVNPATGIAEYNRIDKVIRLGGVLGRAITIHESNDKGSDEQPSGDAGARVGFCVIGYSNPDVLTVAT